jgi:hypothetical protein
MINAMPPPSVLYNMAVGGWGAVEYLEALPKALHFLPRVVVIAFYTGNDPLESFIMAYSQERWAHLRPSRALKASDSPALPFPAPQSEWWTAHFRNGRSMIITPKLRLASSQNHPAVDAGYAIMTETARRMAGMAAEIGVQVVFTVIPTKELVYAKKVEQEGIRPPAEYTQLIQAESSRIAKFTDELRGIGRVVVVDLVAPLQQAALSGKPIYPESENGHPLQDGYGVIGAALGATVRSLLPPQPRGVVHVPIGHSRSSIFLVKDNKRWLFESEETLRAYGWTASAVPRIPPRDIANMPFGGVVSLIPPNAPKAERQKVPRPPPTP